MPDRGSGYLSRPAPSGLADVVEIILDKGVVIDAYVRVSALGIELLTLDARIVVSSVDTYLRFAEATNRLDLQAQGPDNPLDKLTGGLEQAIENVAESVVQQKVEQVPEPVKKTARGAAKAAKQVSEKVRPGRK